LEIGETGSNGRNRGSPRKTNESTVGKRCTSLESPQTKHIFKGKKSTEKMGGGTEGEMTFLVHAKLVPGRSRIGVK